MNKDNLQYVRSGFHNYFSKTLGLLVICISLTALVVTINAKAQQPVETTTSNPPLQSNTVLLLGDSIGAGYGVDQEYSWGAMLGEHLAKQDRTFINASVSGETTGGALRRLDGLLEQHKPALVIIELGGNDGLRGHPIKGFQNNLNAMIELAQKSDAKVYLLGMMIPPNYGQIYSRLFQKVYTDAAERYQITLLPFVLENIATDKSLMQSDGIHPNRQAQEILFNNVLSKLPSF